MSETVPASRLVRLVAFGIDTLYYLLMWLVPGMLVTGGLMVAIGGGLGATFGRGLLDRVGAGAFGILGWVVAAIGAIGVIWMLVVQCLSVANHGASLGKRLVGIKMIDERGAQVGFYRGMFLRGLVFQFLLSLPSDLAVAYTPNWLAQVVVAITVIVGLIDLLYVFGPQRRTLHDFFAGTRVVNAVGAPALRTALIVGGVGLVGAGVVGAGVAFGAPGFWTNTAHAVLAAAGAALPADPTKPTDPTTTDPTKPADPTTTTPTNTTTPTTPTSGLKPAKAAGGGFWTYTDAQGRSHIVDSIEKVPLEQQPPGSTTPPPTPAPPPPLP